MTITIEQASKVTETTPVVLTPQEIAALSWACRQLTALQRLETCAYYESRESDYDIYNGRRWAFESVIDDALLGNSKALLSKYGKQRR